MSAIGNQPAASGFMFSALPLWRRIALDSMRVSVDYGLVAAQMMHGPTIVACNHQSLLDGIIVALASPRPMVFPVTPRYSRNHPLTPRLLRWLERRGLGRVVTMDGDHIYALRELRRALAEGDSVCIFPEGRIGDGGCLQEQPGFRWLHEQTGCPVVRAVLTGADRSRLFAKAGSEYRPAIHLAL